MLVSFEISILVLKHEMPVVCFWFLFTAFQFWTKILLSIAEFTVGKASKKEIIQASQLHHPCVQYVAGVACGC